MAKKRKKGKTNKQNNTNVIVVGTVFLSVLLMVLIFTESGYVGIGLSNFLGGMLGWIKYVLPISMFVYAINLAYRKKAGKTTQYLILIFFLAVVASVFDIIKGGLDISKNMQEIMKTAYNNGANLAAGGGAIGALVAVYLVKFFGKLGAVIVSIGVAIILFVVTFGIDISYIISCIVERILESREVDEEELEEQLKERELRRAQREEKRKARNEERIRRKHEKAQEQEQEEQMQEQNQEDTNKKTKKKKYSTIQEGPIGVDDGQIEINLNGRNVEEEPSKSNKKYKHDKDDIVPLGMENKKMEPDFIESNLFKQEQEQKEDKTKQVLQLEHTVTVEDENYEYPPIELLSIGEKRSIKGGAKALTDVATKLQKTLYSFGVSAKVENVSVGPAITRYELKPAEGVRVSKIANLADDIALNLAAETIRIEAPIPGKQAVGIEVPNKEKEAVHLRDVIESDAFQNNKSKLSVALGKDVAGNTIVADIAKMPHALIAGSTGSGKSVCINTIITSIIYNSKPSEVKLLMVDPKIVELSVYNGIPHLLIPVVTDPKKAAGALAWAVQEMENRYALFAAKGVRDLKGYNAAIEKEVNRENGEEKQRALPQIVIIIDELADLMMVAAKDVEDAICRLAQKARAAGMHLVIATQRPSVDVITGIIKANVPSRIAFAVSSQVDSRTILDMAGAEKLLGKGDMLFYPAGSPKPVRVQGAFVSDEEVEKIVDFVKTNGEATYSEEILESIEQSNKTDKEIAMEKDEDDDTDPFLMDAIQEVIESGQASTSYIQRKFKVGHSRAGRIIDQMEERGIVSGYQGSKPRQVLMSKERWQELQMQGSLETIDNENLSSESEG